MLLRGSLKDVMLVFLNQQTYDRFCMSAEDYEFWKTGLPEKEKDTQTFEPLKIELENIEDRIVRLTPNSASLAAATLDKEGSKLYCLASFEGGFDLWETDLRQKSTKLLQKLNSKWSDLQWENNGKELFL